MKTRFVLTVFAVTSLFTLMGCGDGFQSQVSMTGEGTNIQFSSYSPADDTVTGDGIKYFGFFASAMQSVGTGDYTSEIKDFTNISWIHDGDIESKIVSARNNKMKSLVVIYNVFYPVNGTWVLPTAGSAEDKAMLARWSAMVARLKPYQDDIVAFYIMDEPYSKGISTADLERISSIVKADFPSQATAMIVVPEDLKKSGWMPASMDWAGFDCYGKDCDNVSNYNLMKQGLVQGQRTFMVPAAFERDKVTAAYDVSEATREYDLCRFDSACVGMFAFLWQSFTDGKKSYKGARDLPEVKAIFTEIGQEITGKNAPTPPVVLPKANEPTRDIYRFFNTSRAEHFFTMTYTEGASLGYQYDGVAFRLYVNAIAGSHPIYRCFSAPMHFLSLEAGCEGGKAEGVIGFASDSPREGTKEIYRLFLPATRDHIATINPSEGVRNGYVTDGPMGYAP